MTIVAWDIETCPTPTGRLSSAQQQRLAKELRWKRDKRPELSEEEASRLVRSLHPFLGWICCISAVSGTLQSGPNAPRSWRAASADEEDELLRGFWNDVGGFPEGTIWATFNGKRFDVPFLVIRSVRHGLTPARRDLLDTYPYSHRPHADLACVWSPHCTLDGLCELLSVTVDAHDMDGSRVAEMVRQGDLDKVVAYCEADAVATFQCLKAMPWVLHL